MLLGRRCCDALRARSRLLQAGTAAGVRLRTPAQCPAIASTCVLWTVVLWGRLMESDLRQRRDMEFDTSSRALSSIHVLRPFLSVSSYQARRQVGIRDGEFCDRGRSLCRDGSRSGNAGVSRFLWRREAVRERLDRLAEPPPASAAHARVPLAAEVMTVTVRLAIHLGLGSCRVVSNPAGALATVNARRDVSRGGIPPRRSGRVRPRSCHSIFWNSRQLSAS
jgi:hypothetical protein